jgi:DNA-binding winged helix-turn-helix (wHTH) protein
MDVSTRLTAGDLVLDQNSREASLRGVPLKLTRLEFDVLAYLLCHQNRAVPRQELLDEVWGEGYSPESNVVDVVVGSLRRKLGDDRRRPRYVITVPGVGYRMPAAVEGERPRRRRALVIAAVAIAAVALCFGGVALSFVGVTRSGSSGDEGAAFDEKDGEIVAVIESRSSGPASVSGDCHGQDVTVSDWKTSGSVSGDVTGTAESSASGNFFYTAGCLEGAAKGTMTIVDGSGDRLEMVMDSIFSVVQLQSPPAPAALESIDALTISGGTGRFANASGDGTCETTTLIDYGDNSGSMTSAARSRCRFTLSQMDLALAHSSVSVRVVANPARVSVVGSAVGDAPSAASVLVLYRNEGQGNLTNLTLTLLPVDGVAMNAISRGHEGKEDPAVRTWRLPDLGPDERQTFEFSLQFQSADRSEVPVVVRLSSPDMEQPVESEPFGISVQ